MKIIIPGTPVPKQRPRMTKTGHTYTPKETRDYEALIKKCFEEQSGEFLEGPLKLVIKAFFPVPKSKPRRIKKAMLSGKVQYTKRPDLDNIIKTIDALNGLAFQDDAQIIMIQAEKCYDETPRLEIELIALG